MLSLFLHFKQFQPICAFKCVKKSVYTVMDPVFTNILPFVYISEKDTIY